MHVLEVKVFVSGTRLFPLLSGSPPLVRGAFQVVFVVHLDGTGQDIVHHHQADIDAPRLHTVQSVKLGQEGPRILVQILFQIKKEFK